ncbi:MAG: AzlC family ABC transporter permease [Pseudomonadota bacterium]
MDLPETSPPAGSSNTSRASSALVTLTYEGVVRGARRLVPVSVFVIPFGIAYGVAAIEAGLTVDQAIAMSAFMFAGASQFAAIDLWQGPLPYLSLALVVLAVNARHLILGAAISPYVNQLPPGRWFLALCLLSDVNFADSYKLMKTGYRDAGLILGGGLLMWVTWLAATIVGVFAGAIATNLDYLGVDVVMAAFFGALTVGSVTGWRTGLPVLVACGVALLTMPLLPSGWNIIAAALAGGVVGAFLPAEDKGEREPTAHG